FGSHPPKARPSKPMCRTRAAGRVLSFMLEFPQAGDVVIAPNSRGFCRVEQDGWLPDEISRFGNQFMNQFRIEEVIRRKRGRKLQPLL
uniref:hypothetical protein n=1 Tax=Arthrobacter globiformis TaxID=1665 RepID=UPI001C0EB680